MVNKKINNNPIALGPYSQIIKADGFVFISGQIGLLNVKGTRVNGDIKVQTERIIKHIQIILHSRNYDLGDIVKTTVYLTNLKEFNKMNQIYGKYFKLLPPARSTVEVRKLPKMAKIEIDAIAYRSSKIDLTTHLHQIWIAIVCFIVL